MVLFDRPALGATPPRVSGRIYATLWALAFCGAIPAFVKLQMDGLLGVKVGVAVVLGVAMLLQQLMVYYDVHLLEDSRPDVRADYEPWLDMPLERWIRVSILVFLLFGVGEVADGLLPLAHYIQVTPVKSAVIAFLDPGNSHLADSLFVKGSLGAFLFLSIWNGFALGFRISDGAAGATLAARASRFTVNVRLFAFTCMSLVSFVYWLFVFCRSPVIEDVAKVLVVIYAILVLTVLSLRTAWGRKQVEARLVAFFR
jgi:hypothetical protein